MKRRGIEIDFHMVDSDAYTGIENLVETALGEGSELWTHSKLCKGAKAAILVIYWKFCWLYCGKSPAGQLYNLWVQLQNKFQAYVLFGYCAGKVLKINQWPGLEKISEFANKGINIFSWLSSLLFCSQGKYYHWLYRLLKIDIVARKDAEPYTRADVFEIDRTFVWPAIYSSFLEILEDLHFHGIVSTLANIFSDDQPTMFADPAISCGLCKRPATQSVRDSSLSCPHRFCYFCAQSALETKGNFVCEFCRSTVAKIDFQYFLFDNNR